MKAFILDKNPNFSESKTSIDGCNYKLRQIKGNGLVLEVTDNLSGTERDHVYFSKSDLRALFMLVCTEGK